MTGSGSTGEWTSVYESDPAVIYAIDAGFRIVRCNEAWDRFALANDGRLATRECQLGNCVLDGIPDELRSFYQTVYGRVLATRREFGYVMACSSPLVRRRFHMSIRPFGDSGLLTVNSLLGEVPHEEANPDADSAYLGAGGMIHMCSHCRRSENRNQAGRWDWVPRFFEPGRRISHGFCPVCANYHYGLLTS